MQQSNSAVRIFKISNGIVTSVFVSIRNEHNYSKFSNTYRHQFLTHLTEWRRFFTLATTPSNQQNQQTWSRLCRHCRLKTLNVVWYGAISCRLVPTIQILVTFETDDNYSIWFDSKWKNAIRTACVMHIEFILCFFFKITLSVCLEYI